MRKILMVLSLMLSVSAQAESIHMICVMGDIADMDIKIEEVTKGKEKLSVILMGMSGLSELIFVNSSFENNSLTKSLESGKIEAIVSKSDLQDSFGGAYLNAGVVQIKKDTSGLRYDVLFAAEGTVYTASCK